MRKLLVNPLNVSKKGRKDKVFDSKLPFKPWVFAAERLPRTESEVLHEALKLPLPPGEVQEVITLMIAAQTKFSSITCRALSTENFILKFLEFKINYGEGISGVALIESFLSQVEPINQHQKIVSDISNI